MAFKFTVTLNSPMMRLTISSLAQNALNRIREIQPSGQVTMAGHSAGGLIVFEVARMLLESGSPEPRVMLMDVPRPYNAFGYYWGELVLHWREIIRNPGSKLRNVAIRLFRLARLGEGHPQVTSQADDLMALD